MEDITHHFGGVGESDHGQQQHHHSWGSALGAVLAPPPSAGLPLSLNTAAATGNSGANSGGSNPVLQLANGGGSLLDACVKAKEPSSSSPYAGDVEAIKAKIISHPHYCSLLAAYLECQKASPVLVTVAPLHLPASSFARARSFSFI
jgi:hypothetical protein